MKATLDMRFWWLPSGFVLAGIIAWGSLVPPSVGVTGMDHGDLLLHFLAYCILSFWFLFSSTTLKNSVLILVAILLYAAAMEGLQHFVPPREPHWLDYAANVIGVIAGGVIAQFDIAGFKSCVSKTP